MPQDRAVVADAQLGPRARLESPARWRIQSMRANSPTVRLRFVHAMQAASDLGVDASEVRWENVSLAFGYPPVPPPETL